MYLLFRAQMASLMCLHFAPTRDVFSGSAFPMIYIWWLPPEKKCAYRWKLHAFKSQRRCGLNNSKRKKRYNRR